MPPTKNRLLVLFGNQLYPDDLIAEVGADAIFMAESFRMCRRYAAHKHKLVLVLSAMRSKADALRAAGHEVIYTDLLESNDAPFGALLSAELSKGRYGEVVYFETESHGMASSLERTAAIHGAAAVSLPSPGFLTHRDTFREFLDGRKRLFMGDFYRWQRKRLHVLLDSDGNPSGGRWSFDDENRKKLPKSVSPPPLPNAPWTEHSRVLVELVDEHFPNHPGDSRAFWLPTTATQAEVALDAFLEERFSLFGDYEDALSSKHPFVFHSVLSPLLNLGLLTPQQVLDRALEVAKRRDVPINSVEGFVRQIIGWREFVRGLWHHFSPEHWQQNFWNHNRRLTRHWYEGDTGIPPLDDAIRRAVSSGYNHHIERLMVIGNLMTLCRVDPGDAYRWFMEMFVDSADWVMAPNVYGMALFSEGGSFTTKPYLCGSNYLRKMSDYPKGPWCDIVDGLYWSFVDEHREFFAANPRSRMMLRTLDRIDAERKQSIFRQGRDFRERVTD